MMKICRIHSLTLTDVKLKPLATTCFMHDFKLLGIEMDDIRAELEGQRMIVYTGDFTGNTRITKCPWCGDKFPDDAIGHMYKHGKTEVHLKIYKFQIELYRERLRLIRAGKMDHTYFVYLNHQCQYCDYDRKRGRGLCSIPESARNKTRSLILLGLTASNFPSKFLKKPNLGYIIGKPL